MGKKENLIRTPLSIVYRQGDVLNVKDGLDLDDKDKVWGIMFSNGLILAINLYNSLLNWDSVKYTADTLLLDDKTAVLPSIEQINCIFDENLDFLKTCAKLRHNGVVAKLYTGTIWCDESHPVISSMKRTFQLSSNKSYYIKKSQLIKNVRLAIVF